MAAAVGISASSVQRIWRAHGLQPHRVRAFKLSNDPRFAEKLRAIVGLYVDPPAHAIVLSVDEKSPDPGARPDPAGAADQEGPAGDHDARLPAQRHHHPVRRAQRARRLRDRAVHAAPPPPGVHPLPQPDRARRAGRQADPCRARQLRDPQAPEGPRLARPPSSAGPSTSRRPPPRGSTPSRASSPSSPTAG